MSAMATSRSTPRTPTTCSAPRRWRVSTSCGRSRATPRTASGRGSSSGRSSATPACRRAATPAWTASSRCPQSAATKWRASSSPKRSSTCTSSSTTATGCQWTRTCSTLRLTRCRWTSPRRGRATVAAGRWQRRRATGPRHRSTAGALRHGLPARDRDLPSVLLWLKRPRSGGARRPLRPWKMVPLLRNGCRWRSTTGYRRRRRRGGRGRAVGSGTSGRQKKTRNTASTSTTITTTTAIIGARRRMASVSPCDTRRVLAPGEHVQSATEN
mmetsp:Transcript_117/g.411  ORF Transcript_117/g.411 Transcript_117/m.411 type:complete len:270 (+) Transcript_117:1441-2250(+)